MMCMSGLLEVVALTAEDARAAEAGGADRIELVGTMDDDGLSPAPDLLAQVRAATTIQLRVMLRLRAGFSTDGGEFTRLRGLASAYRDEGADGMVLGFLNGLDAVDVDVTSALVADADWPWTFHRAIDAAFDTDRAWQAVTGLPRVDTVLTAGSARGVEHGLDDLVARARSDERARALIMAGGGLAPEHVPWLVRAGVRKFHVGTPVRLGRRYENAVDSALVESWRDLLDDEIAHVEHC